MGMYRAKKELYNVHPHICCIGIFVKCVELDIYFLAMKLMIG